MATLKFYSHNDNKKRTNGTRFADGSAIEVRPSVTNTVRKDNIWAFDKLFTGKYDTLLL